MRVVLQRSAGAFETPVCDVYLEQDGDDMADTELVTRALVEIRNHHPERCIVNFRRASASLGDSAPIVATCVLDSTRPNDVERCAFELIPLPVLNCFECQWCQGPVDRFAHVFQCRTCKAIGDLNTGILEEPYKSILKRYGAGVTV